VFFEPALLTRLLHIPGDVAAVDSFDETISGSAAFLTSEGRVRELRMGQSATSIGSEPLYKTVNIYRFTAETLRERIVPALDALVEANQCNSYVEQCLARLLQDETWKLRAALCKGTRWYEIDSQADLRRAESIFDDLREAPSLLEPALYPSPAGT
jgi:choline kinase